MPFSLQDPTLMSGLNPVFKRMSMNTKAGVSELEVLKMGIRGQLERQMSPDDKFVSGANKAVAAAPPLSKSTRPSSTRQLVQQLRKGGGAANGKVEDVGRRGEKREVCASKKQPTLLF
jgi:hypothetical protein